MLSYALLALGAAELASAAGVTALLTPTASAPAGCSTDYPGVFQVTIATLDATVGKRQAMNETSNSNLNLTLSGGVLRDYPEMRYGYIASNYQFQFDANEPQAGALYTAGFAVCQNGTLALGANLVFDECQSGDFYNLYLNNSAAQCTQILINALPASSGTASAASSSVTAKVSQITDGQVQATTAITSIPATTSAPKVSQITDGQIQATTAISKVPATTTSVPRVSQISDGQIQATTAVTSAPALFTGAAVMPKVGGEFFAAAAGVAALALF